MILGYGDFILSRADVPAQSKNVPAVIHSAQSGLWSAPATWEGNQIPRAGARVLIRTGHRVVYDVQTPVAIRAINVAGTLSFGGSVPDEYLTCCAVAGVVLAPRMPAPAIAESPHNTPRRSQVVSCIVSSWPFFVSIPRHRWI